MPKSIWKAKDGTIVAQDPQYDDQMAAQGYEPASEAEADAWAADTSPEQPFVDTTQPPREMPSDIDRALVDRIKASGVSEDEAIRRATNVSLLMKNPEQAVVRQGEVGEFEDTGSVAGTILEGIAGGLTMGIVPFLEGLAGNFLEENFPESMTDNRLTAANIERRRQANPKISLGADIGAALTQGGLSVLRQAAPAKFAEKGVMPFLGRAITSPFMDPATRLSQRVGGEMLAARAGTTLSKQTAEEAGKLATIRGRAAAGEALSEVEKQVLGRTGTTIGKISEEELARSRAMYVLQEKMVKQFESAGYGKALATTYANLLAGLPAAAAGGALAGAVRSATTTGQKVASGEDVRGMGEALGTSLLEGGIEGTTLGIGLGLAVPAAATGLGLTTRAVRGSLQKLTQTLYPTIGSTFTTARPLNIEGAVALSEQAVQKNYRKDLERLLRTLQYQYDYAEQYTNALLDQGEVAAGVRAAGTDATSFPYSRVSPALREIKNNFMKQRSDGKWVYDAKKLTDAFEKQEIINTPMPSGEIISELPLPPQIQNLDDLIINLEKDILRRSGLPESIPLTAAGRQDVTSPTSRFLQTAREAGLGFAEAPYPTSPFAIERQGMFPLGGGVSEAGGLRLSRDIIGRAPATETLFLDKALESVGKRLEPSGLRAIGEIAIPTIIGQQAGLGLGEAIGVGAGLAGGAKLLFNPRATIENYTKLQRLNSAVIKGTENFAHFLTRRGELQTNAVKTLMSLDPLTTRVHDALDVKADKTQMIEALRKNFSLSTADELYKLDKATIDAVNAQGGVNFIDKIFSGDFDVVDATYPNMAASTSGVVPRQLAFLNSKLPKAPQTWDVNKMGEWKPNGQKLYEYGLYSRYVHNPDAIYQDIAEKNYVPAQGLEVLKQVYPTRYNQLRQQLFTGLLEARNEGTKIDGKQQKIIDAILEQQTSGLTPAQIQSLQSSIQLPPSGKGGGFSSKLPELERTGTTTGQ